MYAKYSTFFNGDSCRTLPSTGYTDSTRFSCVSIPQMKPQEIKKEQCNVSCKIPEPVCTYSCDIKKDEQEPGLSNKTKIMENYQYTPLLPSSSSLLPVMNPEFNMREICKQLILLEDHLSHQEKRCTDCCIKHFLTIEALAEEAMTLDKENKMQHISGLPTQIRELQKKWHENPNKNSMFVSQKLREIRKKYMIQSFSVVFTKSSCNECSNGVCKIKN